MWQTYHLLPPLALLLASSVALAQGISLPSQADVAKAMERAREAMTKAPGGNAVVGQMPSVPNVHALPKPQAPAPDLASIAQKYNDLGKALVEQQKRESDSVDLLVLVSLSMPKEALNRIIDQAERSGATLVFRGLKGDSMMKMTEELNKLIGGRNVNAAIHPPAFQQFSVTRVPTVVLARGSASNVMENGCAPAGTFVKVAGDVSLDYALDYIERRSDAWAADARRYRDKIVRTM